MPPLRTLESQLEGPSWWKTVKLSPLPSLRSPKLTIQTRTAPVKPLRWPRIHSKLDLICMLVWLRSLWWLTMLMLIAADFLVQLSWCPTKTPPRLSLATEVHTTSDSSSPQPATCSPHSSHTWPQIPASSLKSPEERTTVLLSERQISSTTKLL